MSDAKRNALAELEENLRLIYAENIANDFYCANIGKVRRIVAELANVDDTVLQTFDNRGFVTFPNCEGSVHAISKCRAIAEEGSTDEKL